MTDESDERPNPPRRGLKKGLYLVPSAFTAGNIGMGFLSVMESLRGFQLLAGVNPDLAGAGAHFDKAAIAIGFALLFDMVDGRIARLTKTTTEIGVQLDSIADVVTFGVAPAVLAFVWGYGSTLPEDTDLHRLAFFLSFMYLICGAFRLARFNVQASRPRVLAEGTIKVDKKSFVGLPIPVAGGLIAAEHAEHQERHGAQAEHHLRQHRDQFGSGEALHSRSPQRSRAKAFDDASAATCCSIRLSTETRMTSRNGCG